MPLFARGNRRQRDVTQIGQCAVGRVRPRHQGVEITHHFPVRELLLDGFGVGQLQRTQDQAFGVQRGYGFHVLCRSLSRDLPGAGRRCWQAEFATVHETQGAEQARATATRRTALDETLHGDSPDNLNEHP
ncbi:hypothetical protein D3C84_1045030 [compost metagenome]